MFDGSIHAEMVVLSGRIESSTVRHEDWGIDLISATLRGFFECMPVMLHGTAVRFHTRQGNSD
ncbi:MAG: hypothetical protein KAZ14_04420 [Nitrosomonas sp.]|nr:hypothetical protein [Nitrosomonas sp.]